MSTAAHPPPVRPTDVLPEAAVLVGDERIVDATGGRRVHVDPSTGRALGDFPLGGAAEVDAAVAAAGAALHSWRASGTRRRNLLLGLAEHVVGDAERLATIRSLETGIPYRVPAPGLAVEWLRHHAGWADKVHGETVPTDGVALDYTIPEPYGVVAVLIPWNAPLDSIGMKVAPALAAGNTVVLKPSELAPFGAIRFGELCRDAGLPAGVVNVVPGAGETGAAVVGHPRVDKISFTGGGATARRVLAAAATTLTPTVLELGGKSACLVFDDADLDRAAATAVSAGVVALSGQACVLPTRLLVHDAVHEEVVARVVDLVERVVVGRPFDDGVQMGPVITGDARDRILALVERTRAQGDGRLVAGGGALAEDLSEGFFVAPTVFDEVDPASELANDEVFGPVLSVLRFHDEAEAVALANATPYGLGGLVFTREVGRAHRVAAALEAGSVGVNRFPPMSPGAPFGGVKESGFGREGGRDGLAEFLRPKNVYVDLGGEPMGEPTRQHSGASPGGAWRSDREPRPTGTYPRRFSEAP